MFKYEEYPNNNTPANDDYTHPSKYDRDRWHKNNLLIQQIKKDRKMDLTKGNIIKRENANFKEEKYILGYNEENVIEKSEENNIHENIQEFAKKFEENIQNLVDSMINSENEIAEKIENITKSNSAQNKVNNYKKIIIDDKDER